MRTWFAAVLFITASTASAQSAREAVRAFAKLQSQTEVGINMHDYGAALGAANFEFKEFADGPEAKKHPVVASRLLTALTRYTEAGMLWQASLSSRGYLYAPAVVKSIVAAYPEVGKSYVDGGAMLHDGGLLVKNALPYYWRDAGENIDAAKKALPVAK